MAPQIHYSHFNDPSPNFLKKKADAYAMGRFTATEIYVCYIDHCLLICWLAGADFRTHPLPG